VLPCMLLNRCDRRDSVLASFDKHVAADYSKQYLCPLTAVTDQCVWIGLFKPWLNWPRPRTCKINTSGHSLRKGHIAAAHVIDGSIVYARWRHMYPHVTHVSRVHSSPQPKRHLYRFSNSCTALVVLRCGLKNYVSFICMAL